MIVGGQLVNTPLLFRMTDVHRLHSLRASAQVLMVKEVKLWPHNHTEEMGGEIHSVWSRCLALGLWNERGLARSGGMVSEVSVGCDQHL